MLDLSLAVVALLVLVVAVVVLLRGGTTLGPARIGFAVAVIVLAAGTFAVTLYRSQSGGDDKPEATVIPPISPAATQPAEQRVGTAVIAVDVPMGHGDKLPQGAMLLDPPRASSDPYEGDVSLLCSTPGKTDHDQNCTGGDERDWIAEAIGGKGRVGEAVGDPFANPATACEESSGVVYKSDYIELATGKNYCLRKTADANQTVALRVPAFPSQQPLPTAISVQTAVLPR